MAEAKAPRKLGTPTRVFGNIEVESRRGMRIQYMNAAAGLLDRAYESAVEDSDEEHLALLNESRRASIMGRESAQLALLKAEVARREALIAAL